MPFRLNQEKGADGKTEDERKDHLSHFILRLAYCRTEDLRRWFLEKECLLVRSRLLRLNEADRSKVMAANGLEYDQVDDISKNARKEYLVNVGGVKESDFIMSNFYKIPFQQALQLITKREVYLESGYAYVPLSKLIGIIISKFRTNLSRALANASSAFDHVSSDPRIGPLLKNVHNQFVGNDFSKSGVVDKLTPDKVDQAAEVNMPLCMKTLQNSLKKDKHMKHWGRLQYGLFLKGAGLDLDAAQVFWEMHFTKLISHDDYIKKYAYTFRHMYGKEGARKNYTPFSCMKIIMGSPPEAGASHGCPYRHMSNNNLINSLSNLKIAPNDIKEMVTRAKDQGHYQLACQKHFDISHPDHQKILPGIYIFIIILI
jgi:DNA primase large subunit